VQNLLLINAEKCPLENVLSSIIVSISKRKISR
jgi:hypothetical protein